MGSTRGWVLQLLLLCILQGGWVLQLLLIYIYKEDVPALSNIKLLQHTSLDESQTETREIYMHVVMYMRLDTQICTWERESQENHMDLPLWVCKTRRETLACLIFISHQPKDSLSVHWLFRKKNAHHVTANAQQIIKMIMFPEQTKETFIRNMP
jgi:hypothetical protein